MSVTSAQPGPSASDHPATWKFDYPIYHVENRSQWRSWLEQHHMSARGVWLCSWRTVHVGSLALVGVSSSFNPVVTVALARLISREELRRRQLLGLALTLVALTAIALG
jgi:drug/metabolite transporter (DMT)-like permease